MQRYQMKKSKIIWIILGAVLLATIAGGVIWKMSSKGEVTTEETTKKKKKISVTANLVPIADRPLMTVTPLTNAEGRNLEIELISMGNTQGKIESAEYVLEYQVAGASATSASGKDISVPDAENPVGLQGTMGALEVNKLPSLASVLLGTCSAGGACVRHEGLSAGALTTTFDAEADFAVAQPFTYFENSEKSKILTTTDKVLTIEAESLAKVTDLVITQAAGIKNASQLAGEVVTVSDTERSAESILPVAYQLALAGSAPKGDFTLKMTVATADATAKIAVYTEADGWQSLETTSAGAGIFQAETETWPEIMALVK